MRVKDVIAILQSFNQEAELRIISDNRQEHGDTVKAIRQQGTHVYIHSDVLQVQTLQTLLAQREQPTKGQPRGRSLNLRLNYKSQEHTGGQGRT